MTTLNQAVKTLNQREATQAALRNEQITRERVGKLEYLVGVVPATYSPSITARLESLERHVRRGFRARLRWLFFGAVLLLSVSLASAAPGLYSTHVYQGETFTRNLTWTDDTGSLVDLTGYHAELKVLTASAGSSTLLLRLTDASGLTLGGGAGTIDWVMTDAQTRALPIGPCRYELRVTNASGVVIYILYGNLSIRDRGNL
jgi:hypothetical protein